MMCINTYSHQYIEYVLSIHHIFSQQVPQQFQDCITTAKPTTQEVSAPKSHKEWQVQGKRVKTSAFKPIWKSNRPWLELRRVEQDDHEHSCRKIKVEAMFCTWCELSHKHNT